MGAGLLGKIPLLLLASILITSVSDRAAVGDSAMSEEDRPTVRVAQGLVRGRRAVSKQGGSYLSFQGLPYAEPPVGPLRFKDAQPPEPWGGELDAGSPGNPCVQIAWLTVTPTGSEDCLHLNVFTPQLPPAAGGVPVMVFIHGGGFAGGYSDPEIHGPDYLVAEGVVMVSINYRLGVFGFLYLNHPAAPGNVGLKDQVAALRWVQQNIAAFGGDPGNVTIFGQSAGGASVHFHMLSPMSKGLFHRAIAMSGSVVNPWADQYEPEQTARRLARALGCPAEDPEEIVAFLRTVDYLQLVKAATQDAPFPREKSRLLAFTFLPTQELSVPGVETFLPAPAKQLLDEGRHHPVPFMIGTTSQESIFLLAVKDFRKPDIAAEVDHWNQTVLPEVRIPPDSPRAAEALAELRAFFMDGKPLGNHTFTGFLDMLTDLLFANGAGYTVRRMATAGKAPVYFYNFTLDSELNYGKLTAHIDIPGASHGDDLGYLFRMEALDPDLPEDSEAAVARRRMVRMWTNFAKSGNPTPEPADPLLGARWPAYSERERGYLEIGARLRPGADLNRERSHFWQRFYRKYGAETVD